MGLYGRWKTALVVWWCGVVVKRTEDGCEAERSRCWNEEERLEFGPLDPWRSGLGRIEVLFEKAFPGVGGVVGWYKYYVCLD
jgi:hypothetical protein